MARSLNGFRIGSKRFNFMQSIWTTILPVNPQNKHTCEHTHTHMCLDLVEYSLPNHFDVMWAWLLEISFIFGAFPFHHSLDDRLFMESNAFQIWSESLNLFSFYFGCASTEHFAFRFFCCLWTTRKKCFESFYNRRSLWNGRKYMFVCGLHWCIVKIERKSTASNFIFSFMWHRFIISSSSYYYFFSFSCSYSHKPEWKRPVSAYGSVRL